MATVLENYYALRGELEQRMAQAPINAVDLWYYGEIVYRVGVLETCQMYLRSAPVSMNTPELLGHYQMMDAYVQSLALERRYGPDRGPDTQKEREAAQSNLGRVIQDYRKRFSAFSPTAAMAYKKEINRVITTLRRMAAVSEHIRTRLKRLRKVMHHERRETGSTGSHSADQCGGWF